MQPQAPAPAPPPAAQSAPAPVPAPAPAPAPAHAVTVEVPGMAAVPLEGLPTTPQAVQGLRERREILRDQLVRANNRREELVEQLDGDLPVAARVGLQQRLDLLDQRILQIESDQALAERLLSGAAPEVLAAANGPPHVPGWVDDDEAIAMAFGSFGVGAVLALLAGRLWWGRRRHPHHAPAAALPHDPRVDHLMNAVDAIAEEVERIGEGQRFVTQLLASRPESVLEGREERQ